MLSPASAGTVSVVWQWCLVLPSPLIGPQTSQKPGAHVVVLGGCVSRSLGCVICPHAGDICGCFRPCGQLTQPCSLRHNLPVWRHLAPDLCRCPTCEPEVDCWSALATVRDYNTPMVLQTHVNVRCTSRCGTPSQWHLHHLQCFGTAGTGLGSWNKVPFPPVAV